MRDATQVPEAQGDPSRTAEFVALGAVELELSADDLEAIEAAVPAGAAAGGRYDDRQMAILDSERG